MTRLLLAGLCLGLVGLFVWGGALYLGWAPPREPADRPIALPESAAPLRITVFGTSLTAHYDWPQRLADCLGQPFEVTRVARGGAASDWALEQVKAVAESNPNVIVLEFSINDADLRHGITLSESAANHRRLLGDLRDAAPDAQIVLMTMSPAHGLRRLLRPRLPAYYDLYRALAAELDTGLLDLYPRWFADSRQGWDLPDGLHPTEASATQRIIPELSAYLGQHTSCPT